jgi:hypothetical protein
MNPIKIFRSALDNKYYKANGNPEALRKFEAGGVVLPSDISSVQAVTVLNEVLGLARPNYNLRNVCRVIPMDNLTMTIPIATSLTGSRKVKPLEEAELNNQAYTDVDFELWKNVVHVAIPDESNFKAAFPLMQMSMQDAGRDLPRMENLDVADALEGSITEKHSSIVYADWGAHSSGVSTTNPFTAIQASINYIQGKGYPVDFMACHPTIFGKFVQNTWVRELVKAGMATLASNGGQFTLPGYPTIRVITDFALTETPTSAIGPIVGSSVAPGIVLGTGPTYATSYRDESKDADVYKIRQFLQPKVVIDDALNMICT